MIHDYSIIIIKRQWFWTLLKCCFTKCSVSQTMMVTDVNHLVNLDSTLMMHTSGQDWTLSTSLICPFKYVYVTIFRVSDSHSEKSFRFKLPLRGWPKHTMLGLKMGSNRYGSSLSVPINCCDPKKSNYISCPIHVGKQCPKPPPMSPFS